MNSVVRFVAVAACLSLGIAQHAAADPIVLTGGSMLVTGRVEAGSVSLTGTRGFSLRALVDPSEGEVSAMSQCGQVGLDCLGGSIINLGTLILGFGFPNAVVTLDGATYDDLDQADSPAGILFELAGTATLPAIQLTPVVITAPFTIGPRSSFFPPFPAEPVAITGAGGTATLRLIPALEVGDQPIPWILDEIQYDFRGAAPIPEPATVLMVAAGLAGAWRSRRRGRSRASVGDSRRNVPPTEVAGGA